MLIRQISNFKLEAGCYEAGRGCLAGPVVAAAVILKEDFSNPLLNDSKKLTEKHRLLLKDEIENEAFAWAVGIVEPIKIDEINILNASFLAMHKALKKLKPQPKFIAIDGNRFNPYGKTPFECVIKGDGKVQNIAAASVLAKTYRDEIMQNLHLKHPEYGWDKNKGYPTKKHREAIKKIGATPFHRMSFTLLPNQLKLQL
jgi:ribonuclease HII